MADSLSAAVERLRTSSERLNSVTDAAGQTVRDTEAYLESLQLGVEAWIDAWNEFDDNGVKIGEVRLAYSRQGNRKYRLEVIWIPENGCSPGDAYSRAWGECSREDKLRSFEKLPDLLTKLAKQIEEMVSKAEKTVASVSAVLPNSKKKKGA